MTYENRKINQTITELDENSVPYCLVTIIETSGSSPRKEGTKMIVTKEENYGTVGGGALEHNAIKDAKEFLRLGESGKKKYSLEEGGIQVCGGSAELFFEPILPAREIIVFGAGHVAEKLVPMLKELNFNITLIDERDVQLSKPNFNNVDNKICKLPSDVLPDIKFHDDLFVIVLTHAHIHDQEIVRFCMRKPFKYLGVIGSKKKWGKFKEDYLKEGFTKDELSRVTTPIGLPIGGNTPFEIAISITSQLISLIWKNK